MLRVSIIGVALVAMTAGIAGAQQQAMPSLAEVARKAEAAKATVRKAKKTYTNADLGADPRGEPAPAPSPAPAAGFVSATTGKPVTAEEIVKRSEEKVEEAEVAKESEEDWRARAQSLRVQIDKLQTRLTALTNPNPARDANAAAKARNESELANVRTGLDGLRKSWANLESSAREKKVSLAWLEPAAPVSAVINALRETRRRNLA